MYVQQEHKLHRGKPSKLSGKVLKVGVSVLAEVSKEHHTHCTGKIITTARSQCHIERRKAEHFQPDSIRNDSSQKR